MEASGTIFKRIMKTMHRSRAKATLEPRNFNKEGFCLSIRLILFLLIRQVVSKPRHP